MEEIKFFGSVFEWRGPSPYYFIEIPAAQSAQIKERAAQLTYGWGVIPVTGVIGETQFTTSLIPKEGLYLLPIKNLVRFGENLEVGQYVQASIDLGKGK
jgi:hypothetical protein